MTNSRIARPTPSEPNADVRPNVNVLTAKTSAMPMADIFQNGPGSASSMCCATRVPTMPESTAYAANSSRRMRAPMAVCERLPTTVVIDAGSR